MKMPQRRLKRTVFRWFFRFHQLRSTSRLYSEARSHRTVLKFSWCVLSSTPVLNLEHSHTSAHSLSNGTNNHPLEIYSKAFTKNSSSNHRCQHHNKCLLPVSNSNSNRKDSHSKHRLHSKIRRVNTTTERNLSSWRSRNFKSWWVKSRLWRKKTCKDS